MRTAARPGEHPGAGLTHLRPELRRLGDGQAEVAGDDHHADLGEGLLELGDGCGLLTTIHAILHVVDRTPDGERPGSKRPCGRTRMANSPSMGHGAGRCLHGERQSHTRGKPHGGQIPFPV